MGSDFSTCSAYAGSLRQGEVQYAIETDRPFYGWVMLGVCAVGMIATAPGQTVIVSQFNTSFKESFGLSDAGLSTAYLIGTVLAAFPLALVGKISDRVGPRRAMVGVALLFGIACVCMGYVAGVVTLTIGFFFIRLLGQGSLGLVSAHALALWFERRLGTANGLKLVATNLGFAAMTTLAIWLISQVGWRDAYGILGLLVIGLVVPLGVFVSRDRPEEMGQRIDGDPLVDPPGEEHADESAEISPSGHRHEDPAFTLGEAVRVPAYWILAMCGVLNGLIGTALLFHIQPLMEARGLDPEDSGLVTPVWNLTMMLVIFPVGWLADRLSARVMLPVSAFMLGLSSVVPLVASSLVGFQIGMVVFAVSQAVSMGVVTPTIARYFGRAHHGAIRGSVSRLSVAGTGLGPVMLGASLSWFGGAEVGLFVFVVMCVPLGIAAMTLTRPVVTRD